MINFKIRTFTSLFIFVYLCFFHGTSWAYNSEEHMLITDIGVSSVNIPTEVKLPKFIRSEGTPNYRNSYTKAKKLATGFTTNNVKDYSRQARAQDNCYWYNYGQLVYNKKNWMPAVKNIPAKIFYVLANTTTNARTMTFGQMVALYGDYRRTTFCNVSGECYLTDADTPTVNFTGNIARKDTYCPKSIDAQDYLRAIGAGLVPPFGSLGNAKSNTANDTDYKEAGWWGDEMLRIANVNDWHFSNTAIAWYVGMHRLALIYVNKAVNEPKYWNQALHYEANALHSLTDLFAFGHVVTNRDETSYGIIKSNKIETSSAYRWMENVITMGSGERDVDGHVSLIDNFPLISDMTPIRKDFLKSYRGSWVARANAERKDHDYFNEAGATVRNLNNSLFVIYGDGKLHEMNQDAKDQIAAAVQASLQSLFDSYILIKQGKTIDEIGSRGSTYFNALSFVPVYIESDKDNYFTGMWTRYAKAVQDITGSHQPITNWNKCQIPYLSGKDNLWPQKHSDVCTQF